MKKYMIYLAASLGIMGTTIWAVHEFEFIMDVHDAHNMHLKEDTLMQMIMEMQKEDSVPAQKKVVH